ncbi:cadherin repeat domain-containing protein [Falsiroseomonas oryzae]|uniref:cadherin repeat domain-containing protein n=1 Tax=Falsiroseomonas oryzae TaxID=2766473 RepID=UPI0022EA960B|nr:cadherin repeat domain-containing protein [Roseomonas sp. MO-31]
MAIEPSFAQSTLLNVPDSNWTSLQFGPDGRLYAAQVDGTIYAFTIGATTNGYSVSATETINAIKAITNYNDDGIVAPSEYQGSRQVTGILVAPATATASSSLSATTESSSSTTMAAASGGPGQANGGGSPPGLAKQATAEAPEVPAPLVASVKLPPGQAPVPSGTFVADVDATDPQGSVVTYSLHPGGNGNGAFGIDPATGVITVADPGKLGRGNAKGPTELQVLAADTQQNTSSVKVLVSVVEQGTEPQASNITAAALAPVATPVVLYVSSSDPRIGAGPGGGDVNLDTNSGVISRLTQNADGSWERLDLVRGLPRSEENHSVNGMQLSADGTKLYVAVGGNTNMGAPSNNFAYTPEYALSAAILVIDLAAVDALPTKVDALDGSLYKYDLPTLDGNAADPSLTDPFGGFDGLNQAMLVQGGPVQIYSPGYRNPYDLVMTEAGRLYTVDNGANAGWGGPPPDEAPPSGGTSSVTNKPNDGGSDTTDHLHLVTQGFYAGHPTPIRANPGGAGWYTDGSGTPVAVPPTWPPVPLSMANPAEGDFKAPGTDGALYSGWAASTNGLEEYTSLQAFEGAMQGNLLTVAWDDQLYRVVLNSDGTQAVAVTKLTAGASVLGGGLPLDVTAQGDGETFAGTIWVANYGGPITIFTPSAATEPPNTDADGDGLSNSVDAFAEDAANGKGTDLGAGQTLVWNFSQNIDPPGPNGLFNMGFTGLMSNGTQSYLTLYDPANIKPGGAAAGFQVEQVSAGDALVGNSQMNGFQFGVDVLPDVSSFTIETKIDNPFGGTPSTEPVNWKSQGFFIGTGDQDNYLKIVAAANGGAGGIEVASENAGTFSSAVYGAGITGAGIQTLDSITLKLLVNRDAATATPSWIYTVDGTEFAGSGAAVPLSGATLQALQGSYSVAGTPSALAVGIISTAFGSGTTFPAFWESIRITAATSTPPPPPAAGVTVVQSGGTTAVTEGGATDTLSVVLASQPGANVTVTVTGTADVAVAAGSGTPAGSATLTFTAADWNVAQTVAVAAVNDTAVEGAETASLTFATSSGDSAYNGLPVAPVPVAVTDNDTASADADGDGLSDTLDRFALDASNGGGNNLAQLGTLTLDFGTGTTPFGSGFTGVMTNGTQAYTALAVSGSVANGKLVVQTTTGDPYGSLNTQQNAYQLGVDTAGVAAFTVASKVDNPFAGGVAAQNWRSAGVMFGTGDQDNYAKLVFQANNGAGGIEFLVENAGTPDGTTVGLGVPTGNVAYGLFYLDVAKTGSGATATPRWTLHDAAGAQIGAGTGAAKALTGALLDAVQGDLVVGGQQSELAVGVISTSFGSSGPITAAWDSLTISTTGTPPPPPAAGVVVTQSGGTTAVTEGGATDMLSVVLASQPGANVTVTVTGTADVAVAAGSGTPAGSATLTFTAADWNVAQTVAVAAVDDTAVEGAETASLTFATSSGDSAYNGLPVAPVPVAVTDNDTASADADGDGLSDTLDRFALDASNGGGNNLAQLGTLTLDFGTGTTPFGSGFTGVMANGTQAYTALAASGSVANGKLVVQTTTGDPYGSLNTQQNAYQLGVDTAGVAAFTVASKVDNPFAGGVAAQNWRSAGVMFGAGDQDNYAKLVFQANNGAGGIEFLVENSGTPDGTTVGLGVPTGNVAYGLFYLDVAKTGSGATATPRWTLHDAAGAQIGAGTGAAKALTGALLDAVQGDLVVGGQQSELAVGVISTSFGSSGPITAAWDSLTVSAGAASSTAAASMDTDALTTFAPLPAADIAAAAPIEDSTDPEFTPFAFVQPDQLI